MLWLWLTIVWEIIQIHTYKHTHIHTYLLFHRLTQNIPIQQQKGKGVSVHTMKVYNGSRGTVLHILNLWARWRWVANITPQLFYAWEGTPVPVELMAEWTLELVWSIWRRGKHPYSAKIQTTDRAACILVTTGTRPSNVMVVSTLYSSQTLKKCTGMTLTSGNITLSCTELMFILE